MKRNSKTVLSLILSVVMVFSLVMIPSAQVNASEDGRPEVMYVTFTDYADNPAASDTEHYMYTAPNYGFDSNPVIPEYKGASFDEKTATLVLKNANIPTVGFFADTEVLNVSVEGTCRVAKIVAHGASKVTFTGSGTLEINAPYTGTAYCDEHDAENAVKLSAKSLFPYAVELREIGDENGYTPFFSISDQLTLKMYGYKAEYDYDGFEKAYCAKVYVADKVANDKSKLIQHNGVQTPEVVWENKLIENDDSEKISSKYHVYYATGSNFYVDKTVSENAIFDNIYYLNTAFGENSTDYYPVTQDEDGKIIISNSPVGYIGSSKLRAASADELKAFSNAKDIQSISVYSSIEQSQGYGYHYTKAGEDYYLSYPGWLYGYSQGKLFGIENANVAEGYILSKTVTNGNLKYQENVNIYGETDYKKVKESLLKDGYTFAGETRYESYFWLTNPSQVFSPKASSGGGGAAVVQPIVTDPKTDPVEETPKAGDTVQKDDGDYKLTEEKDGKMTAEFSSNEKTLTQKTVTVPDVVEVNGEKVPVTSIAEGAFSGSKSLTTLKFKGKNLKKVGKNAFAKCPNLKSAVLPDSVREIGQGAFDGNKKLGKLTVNGNNLKKVGKNALRGIKKNATITIKAKNQSKYKKAVNMIKKAGNKKLKFKFKKAKK